MNTSTDEILTVEQALKAVPGRFRNRIKKYYQQLKTAYTRGDYDSCGTRAGKFCETFIRFLQHELEGKYEPFGNQINIYDEALRLSRLPATSGAEQFRVFIPRALCFLYTLRNKRGFAHVGGDIDSERLDAMTCVRVADWILCELIRVVHALSLEEAQALVDSISTKEVPEVWSVAGKRRVLDPKMKYKDQTLLLLYSEVDESVLIEDLFDWTEYSNFADFKRHVLGPLHRDRLIEWDSDTDTATLSPTGIEYVEQSILELAPAI